MMKQAFSFVLVLILPALACAAGAAKTPLADELIAAEKRVLWEAVLHKQMDVLRGSLADDYLDVSDVGVFTKSETLQAIPDLAVQDYSLDKFKVIKVDKDSAIVTYEAVQHWTFKGQTGPTHVRATSVWVKRGDQWLVVFHQESTIN
jgi:hypothetical protein